MDQRGRKSASAVVAAHAVEVLPRPEPALDLTEQQADEWRKIVDALPADWFSPENHALLAQYVRHVVEARRIAQLIDTECAKGSAEMDMPIYLELLKAQRQESTALKTLAASMRLAQQAKYGAQSAATAKKAVGSGRRIWDRS